MVGRMKYFVVVIALISHCDCVNIGSICQTLWNADTNSLHHGTDFQLNVQNHISSYSNKYDMSRGKLFTWVNEAKLNGPTWTAFKALLDNYDVDTGYTEVLTDQEKIENENFLTAIMATDTMKKLHSYLNKTLTPSSDSSFKFQLKKMWLYFYRRNAYRDSSGFEHVFLGELQNKNGQTQVSGFHNWLQFYLEEKNNNMANYYGYFSFQKNVEPVSLKFQMSWYNYLKPVTGFFVGTSPEIELALYTACFKVFPNQKCECNINGQNIAIQTYDIAGSYVGTAYPVG